MTVTKFEFGSPQFINTAGDLSEDSKARIDQALNSLTRQKDLWSTLPLHERITILDEINKDLYAVSDRWVSLCAQSKGIFSHNTFALGEEWVFLAAVFRLIRLLRQSLVDIAQQALPELPAPVITGPNEQLIAPVLPQNTLDRLLHPGTSAEVWLAPGSNPNERAAFYRHAVQPGQLALVLGAGNVSTLVPSDILHAMFVKGQVVILKPNPVNDYLGPLIEAGFQTLIRRDFLRVIYGGVAEGNYLSHHPLVDAIHLTGSDKTFEAIVFGPGSAGQKRKISRHPISTKPFTAELGSVSPIIVVPGSWSNRDIMSQARKIATWLTFNAGFNCLTPRVLIQSRHWPHRHTLNRAIGHALAQIETRQAYYPGAHERQAQFREQNSTSLQFGAGSDGHLPWTFILNVPPDDTENICFRREAFCGLMAETSLEASSVADFIDRTVAFANQTLWGTLTASLIVHPRSLKKPEIAVAVERAIGTLQYGTVLVNQYGGYAYYLMTTPWGSYPGQDIFDIQSGIGSVNNAFMFDWPQKSVVRSPFTQVANPVQFSFKHFNTFGQKLVDFERSPTWVKLSGLLWDRVRP